MTLPANSADLPLLVSRSAARDKFRSALRLFVGRGKRYSVKQASNGTGIKDRMIESFMAPLESNEYRKPDFEEILSLASFIGPDFSTELLELAHQGAYWLPESDDLPPGVMAADNSDDNATLVRAAMNGEFEAAEKPDLQVVGQRMMIRGATLRAMAA